LHNDNEGTSDYMVAQQYLWGILLESPNKISNGDYVLLTNTQKISYWYLKFILGEYCVPP